MINEILRKTVDFYGGEQLWMNAKKIEATVSAKGLAFTLKRRPVFNNAKIVMDVNRPFVTITPIGNDPEISGVLDVHDVRLIDRDGNILSERKNARTFFPFGRRLFYWDDMDMAYFANYAFWNYFTLPRLIINKSINWRDLGNGMIEAEFPDEMPTHSRFQQFRINQNTGALMQHNYAVDIIAKLAKAANVVEEHKNINGIMVPALRKVTPQKLNGTAMNGPVLIDITVHDFKLIS